MQVKAAILYKKEQSPGTCNSFRIALRQQATGNRQQATGNRQQAIIHIL